MRPSTNHIQCWVEVAGVAASTYFSFRYFSVPVSDVAVTVTDATGSGKLCASLRGVVQCNLRGPNHFRNLRCDDILLGMAWRCRKHGTLVT